MSSCNMLENPYVQGNRFILLIVFIFCRLKINYDSHEFTLESGTITDIILY
jgi:hypothetical protein